MKRTLVMFVLAGVFAVVLVGGVVGVAAAQPGPTPDPTPVADGPVLGDDVADALAQAEAEADSEDENEGEEGGGPSLFERALCGISPALCATSGLAGIPSPGEALADLGEAAGNSILEVMASSMVEGVEWVLDASLGWWIGTESLITQEQAVFLAIGGQFFWIAGGLTLLGVLWQAIRLLVTRSAHTIVDAGGSMLTIAVVSTLGWTVITQFSQASDQWAAATLSAGIDSPGAIENLTGALATMPPAASILFAAVLFVSSLIQAALMVVRDVAAVLLAALMPFAASARMFGWGRSWLPKLINSLVSIILYKPIAAAVMFGAMTLFSQGETTRAVVSGTAMLALSTVILPALMRLFAYHDVGGGVVSGGGGGRALAAGTVVAAGAVMTGGASDRLAAAAVRGGAAAAGSASAPAPRVRVQDDLSGARP